MMENKKFDRKLLTGELAAQPPEGGMKTGMRYSGTVACTIWLIYSYALCQVVIMPRSQRAPSQKNVRWPSPCLQKKSRFLPISLSSHSSPDPQNGQTSFPCSVPCTLC